MWKDSSTGYRLSWAEMGVEYMWQSDVIVVMPVFNDGHAAAAVIADLDEQVASLSGDVRVVLVDDGSTEPLEPVIGSVRCESIVSVGILALRRNLGHQRALAIGLAWIEENTECRRVVVMDGDGEDLPEDVPRLLRKLEEEHDGKIVFAERSRRSETVLFRLLYRAFKLLHLALTGIPVRFGNFSVIPRSMLCRLVVVSDLWNHYAASVLKARLPFSTCPTIRGTRTAGKSRMNLVSLVMHGLSAISVFGDRVGVRVLVALGATTGVLVVALIAVAGTRLCTDLAIPGWATYMTGFLSLMLLQVGILMLAFSFVVLGARGSAAFIPIRDYGVFVDGIRTVWPVDE